MQVRVAACDDGSAGPALSRLQRNSYFALCYELAGGKTLESSAWRAGPNQDLGRDEPDFMPRWSNQDFVMPTVLCPPAPAGAPDRRAHDLLGAHQTPPRQGRQQGIQALGATTPRARR